MAKLATLQGSPLLRRDRGNASRADPDAPYLDSSDSFNFLPKSTKSTQKEGNKRKKERKQPHSKKKRNCIETRRSETE